MDTRTIREQFIAFFTERDHQHVPSGSLIPPDPSLLFTNAGMNQFKPYFAREQTPPYERAVTSQKCLRAGGKHNDLEEVGRTTRHLTFFEMLGNFSFGDYFKDKICPWSWELVTERWGMDPDKLWVSIYETDDEAHDIWVDLVGVRPERVLRFGKKDNYWSMGVAGPCGPCSELHIDRGEGWGEASPRGPMDNDERYLEFWNLVFMQNNCDDDLNEVGELPFKNIDTGAGLERIAMLLQGKPTVFETDLLMGMIDRASDTTGLRYGKDAKTDFGLRVLADHGRAMTFAIADGILPSNEERGYVLRRIIRRAIRHTRLMGYEGPVLADMVGRCVELMGDTYLEIKEKQSMITDIVQREEDRFSATLKQGLGILEGEIEAARGESRGITGDVAFKLHDTFGFPIDLTREIAAESEVAVDRDEFDTLMTQQRERARSAQSAARAGSVPELAGQLLEERGSTEFIGYEFLETTGEVLGLIGAGAIASEGDEADIVLDRTVFYAAGGGQVGDKGRLVGARGTAEVLDTVRIAPGLTAHRARVTAGEIAVGDELQASVDAGMRRGSERAHTATHILHWILRDRLGEHAKQAGSLVEPGRLRFDFNHFDALGSDRVAEIGEELQTRVLGDDRVRAYETSFEFARSTGAMAIFGEKYGDVVRVVEVGEYSKELCGGTHVPHTSNIGVVVLTAEGSVGANLRRVEALVGNEGVDYLMRKVAVLERAAETLKSNPDEVAEKVERLVSTQKDMERKIGEIERASADSDAAALAGSAEDLGGSRLVVARRDGAVDQLRSLALSLKGRLGPSVVVLGTAGESNANLVVAVSKDLAKNGVSARELVAPGAKLLGGGGGGKPELAISGGPHKDKLDEALAAVASAVKAALGS
jgi:alanyl-tRNA synthetase